MSRQFLSAGKVFPRGCPEGPAELRAECLIEGSDPEINATARFTQAIERLALDATDAPVSELVVAGQRYAGGEETLECEIGISSLPNRAAMIKLPGSKRAELTDGSAPAAALAWRWDRLHATIEGWIEKLGPGLRRVRIQLANRLEWEGGTNEQTLAQTLRAAHVLLHSPDGAFASLAYPPAHLREQAAACRNEGFWPVPVGEAGDRRTMLAAPLRLEDYPEIAPASGSDSVDRRSAARPHHAALR